MFYFHVSTDCKCFYFCPGSGTEEGKTSIKEESAEESSRPFNYDVVDVSKGFLTRIAYKKKVKTSKLDSLLERRVKQHIIEESQRPRVSASDSLTPAPASSTSTPALDTPVRPRSPLRPHALTQKQLTFGDAVKAAETTATPESGGRESRSELSETPDENVTPLPPLPSPTLGSTPKDSSSSTGTGEHSASPQTTSMPQGLEADLVERTMGPKETNSDSSGEEGGGVPDLQQTAKVSSDESKAAHVENTWLKLDPMRTSTGVLDQKSSQNTPPSKLTQQNPETLSSAHSGTEKNGTGPQEDSEGIGKGKSESVRTPKPVSPLPQVNGNDGLGSESILRNSVVSANNGVLTNNTQHKMNSVENVEEQGQVVPQQKPLVNGDVARLIDVGVKETSPECEKTRPDQDFEPPVKVIRLENPVENTQGVRQLNSSFKSTETKPSPVVKIIRMAPSPIPSAEESSLSDDFTEENSNSGTVDPLRTITTQVTTTSTTTTTVVSTETRTDSPGETRTTESNAVSTLTTMTKTTVTKICSSDSRSDGSQSEIITQEEKLAASVSRSTSDSKGGTVAQSREDYTSTKSRVRLLKFSRTKKTRSDTALPSYRKFVTKSNRKSIFVLPHDDLKVLGRRGGFREVPIFSYNAKPALDIWPYPSPRPTFGITWR